MKEKGVLMLFPFLSSLKNTHKYFNFEKDSNFSSIYILSFIQTLEILDLEFNLIEDTGAEYLYNTFKENKVIIQYLS